MPFSLPTFNLSVNVYRNYDYNITNLNPVGAPNAVFPGNLQFGRKEATGSVITNWVLFPSRTDIRGVEMYADFRGDVMEIPAGSGRFFVAYWIEDVARGFPNEYRAVQAYHPVWVFGRGAVPLQPIPYP